MTESATQSNTKRHKLHSDRISDLPEPLLCHILSFLPTKQSVATTILSRTWNHLWTLVPKLDLDTTTIDASFNLEPIVYRLLSLQRTPCLQNFRLKFLYGCSSFNNRVSYLETWLRIAAARKVEELDLDLEIYFDYESIRYKPLQLPPSFFSCTTLVVLKLRGDIHIDPPSSFQFPSLKIMHLINISHAFNYFSLRLISACPVLEELSCERKYLDGEYKICVLTLKRLSITLREAEFVSKFVAKFVAEIGLFGCEYKLEIKAPALEYFNFEGNLRDIKIHEKLDNLVQANVDIWTFEDDKDDIWRFRRDDGHEESYSDRCLLNDNIYPYLYKNLVRLDFKVNDCSWHVLQGLLQNAPNLEILDVTKSCDFFEHDLGWKQPRDDLDNLLSHLKSLFYRGFEGLESEVEFLKYILKHARVLKTVTIQVSGKELKGNVLEKLSMFPRCSTCLLTVE